MVHKKEVAGDEIIEVKVWKVEKSTNYPEGINYRMVVRRVSSKLRVPTWLARTVGKSNAANDF